MTEDTEVQTRRHDHMRKIQALLDRASNTPYEAEADAARAKADELMTLYVIESWEVDQLKPRNMREEVTTRMMDVCSGHHIGKEGFRRLVSAVAVHCRCRILYYDYDQKIYPFRVKLWGFPSDLDYAEMLWTSLLLQLTKDMKPDVNPNQTWEENLVRLKESGMKWEDIHRTLCPGVPWDSLKRSEKIKYTTTYTNYCKRFNRTRVYATPTVFVRSFVDGFATRVDERLWDLRDRQKEYVKGPGTDIVLRDRKQEIDDAYAQGKGNAKSIRVHTGLIDSTARGHGQRAGDRADLAQTRLGRKKEIT